MFLIRFAIACKKGARNTVKNRDFGWGSASWGIPRNMDEQVPDGNRGNTCTGVLLSISALFGVPDFARTRMHAELPSQRHFWPGRTLLSILAPYRQNNSRWHLGESV